jgi:hypothetical protein
MQSGLGICQEWRLMLRRVGNILKASILRKRARSTLPRKVGMVLMAKY